MNIKRGFTLAEVLVTLGIIGVVAAITMPSLNLNVSKNTTEARFMKAYNTLQNASGLVMAEKRMDTLWEACEQSDPSDSGYGLAPATNYLLCLNPYIKGFVGGFAQQTKIGDYTFKTNSGGVKHYIIKTKDGIEIASYKVLRRASSLSQSIFKIVGNDVCFFVDVNGFGNGPNQFGKDVFVLLMDVSTGEVFGRGSNQYSNISILSNSDIKDDYNFVLPEGSSNLSDAISASTVLNDNNKRWTGGNCDKTGVADSTTCAGSILDNNGKIVYSFNKIKD